MTISVTIQGVDRTGLVNWESLNISQILTKSIDTAGFSILQKDIVSFNPVAGQEVIITADGTKIFAGMIVEVESRATAYKTIEHIIQASDYGRVMDSKLISAVFENMTVDAIIADLIVNYFPVGLFTNTNVNCPVVVKYLKLNYVSGCNVMNKLAELTGYDWYVDYDKDIHFFIPQAVTAPIDLEDDNGSYEYESLVLRSDNSQIKNSIIVRGGEYLGTQFTTEILANGTDTIYPLAYKYSDFSVTLTSERLNVGVDPIDNANLFDVLYNFQEKIIKFRDSRKPTTGSVMRIGGKPYLPVIVELKDQQAINATLTLEGNVGDGVYEYLIVDKSINSKEGARQRAQAEINTYAATLIEGEFISETAGFEPGQKVLINSASRNLNVYYIVSQVNIIAMTPTQLKYQVKLISTKVFGFIDLLKRLLLADADKIEINDDEVIDRVESASEDITVIEAVVASSGMNALGATLTVEEVFVNQGVDYGIQFVLGPQVPATTKRVFILNGSRLI